jgi:microcystin degradation protein MlrC
MRIAAGGIVHETNTYAVPCTGLTAVESFHVDQGAAITAHFAGTGWAIGGIVDECARRGDELVPTLYAWAEPSGTIEAGAYAEIKGRFLEALAAVLPVDAIALELHGAGVVDGIDDLEADLGRAIRELVGPHVPIAATLDLHGNTTPAMADAFDLLLGCHLYPHTDLNARGVEAVDLLHRVVEDGLRPVVHVEPLPILLPCATTDGASPAAATNELCAELERQPGVLDCTFMHGFPFTDVPATGSAIIATTDGDPVLAASVAKRAAAWVWDHRQQFRHEDETPESAVRRAGAAAMFPVVINECSDNPGGGTPGDGTHLLRAMLDAGIGDACFAFIADEEVVRQAVAAGVGARIDAHLGGKHDDLHGTPVRVSGLVRCITDGRLVLRAMLSGTILELGPSCRLTVDGVDVVVMSKPFQTIDPEVFVMHGIDVTRYKVVGLKSSQHFRAGFRDLAAEIITADSPGLTTNRVEVFEHARAGRALWPLDPAARYGPA